MVRIPDLDFETPAEELSPQEAHDRWEAATNLDSDELQTLEETKEHDVYLERASGREETDGPIPGGPLDDAQHLASTPRSEWGADERAEAAEALDYGSRHFPQYEAGEGEDLTPGDETKTTKADVAHARWGFDLKPEDNWP